MDTPRVPDDNKNWDSIEIFLFSNGQQYSPPRKYHLKSEELKCWDATLSNLARSQFGSLYSIIDLYTLDGKKIDAPLELINDAAYVAVTPPDVFVQTGYEKYLIKAIRSREKRQERMKTEAAELANCEINKKLFESNLNIPDDTTLNTVKIENDSLILKTENLATATKNTFNHSQKGTKNVIHSQNNNNFLKLEKQASLTKRKPSISANNALLKKNVKNKNDGQDSYKRKNTNFPKKIFKSCTNSKGSTTPSNNSKLLKTHLESNVERQDKLQDDALKTTESKLGMNEINDQLNVNLVKNNSSLGSSKIDLTVFSNVYKNTQSDIQSVFLDADRKTALLNKDQRKLKDLQSTEVLGETPKNQLNVNKAKQSLGNLTEHNGISNQPPVFNVNLRIDLIGCTVFNDQDGDEFKCKSYITLLKAEKATQVNIDVAIRREHSNYSDAILISEKSDKFLFSLPDQENSVDNTRVILIHCRCYPFKSEVNKATTQNFNENDNSLNEKFVPRSNRVKSRIGDKETQDSLLHSCNRIPAISNSKIMLIKKNEFGAKHKVSISQEAPKELNSHNIQEQSEEDMQIEKTKHVISVYKIDNSTQTDWCNVLLQAKFHENGRYTFHLPTLQLLKNYNLLNNIIK